MFTTLYTDYRAAQTIAEESTEINGNGFHYLF